MAFFLRPLKPDSSGSEGFHIPADATVLGIGRGAGNELRLENDTISRIHARVEASGPGRFEVVDCGSSNGTFVNGSRVERHPLVEGDLVCFATVEFRVELREVAAKAAKAELSDEKEVVAREFARLRDELNEAREALGHRDAELIESAQGLEEELRKVRRLERELEEAVGREERVQAALGEARRETLDRDVRLSALRHEHGVLEGRFDQSEAERSRLAAVCEEQELALRQGEERLAVETAALAESAQGLEEELRKVRRLERELEEAVGREERVRAALDEARRETVDREGGLSALLHEHGELEGRFAQSEAERSRLAAVCEEQGLALRQGEERLATGTTALAELAQRLKEELRKVRRLERELEEAVGREERVRAALGEARRETLDRDVRLSALRQEHGVLEGRFDQSEAERSRLAAVCEEQELALRQGEERLAAETAALAESAQGLEEELRKVRRLKRELEGRFAESEAERSRLAAVCEEQELALRQGEERLAAETAALAEVIEAADAAESAREGMLACLGTLADRLLEDWRARLEHGGSAFPDAADAADENGAFPRFESVAARIREELDRIEPVWLEFGGRVHDELVARCEGLRTERNELEDELHRRREELVFFQDELAVFRELLDAEVRRAQGLCRRGLWLEIPARVEAMVVPKDREVELCRSLLLRIEALDRLLSGYWRSRRLRGVHSELRDFLDGLFDLLASCGVRPFKVEAGTSLAWSHREEVQVLGRKGWGTREFEEQPFRPGEVVTVVRPGYRIGEGVGSTVLRKVEVLIRERRDGR